MLGRLVGLGRLAGGRGVSTSSQRVMVLNCGSSSVKFQVKECGHSRREDKSGVMSIVQMIEGSTVSLMHQMPSVS